MGGVKTCAKCGEAKPLEAFYRVSNSNHRDGRKNECKECWRQLRRDRYARRRETELAVNARWREENRDRHRELQDRWSAENPEAARVYQGIAAARKSGVRIVESVHPLVVLELDDGACGICGDDVDPDDFEIDHIIPRSKGGEHSYANVQVAHASCNLRKAFSLPE